jgi:hypothetical protein
LEVSAMLSHRQLGGETMVLLRCFSLLRREDLDFLGLSHEQSAGRSEKGENTVTGLAGLFGLSTTIVTWRSRLVISSGNMVVCAVDEVLEFIVMN